MKSTNWKDITELVGIAAIVISLIFVGLQMRQDQVIARAELGSGTFDYSRSIEQSLQNPAIAGAYLTMLQNPDDLTDGEKVLVNAFLSQIIQAMTRECYLVLLEVFPDCTTFATQVAQRHFGNSYAKEFYRVDTLTSIEPINDILTPIVESQPDDGSTKFLN